MARLEQRVGALEARLQPAAEPVVILVTGMARIGFRWIPNVFSMPSGTHLRRSTEESPERFIERVEATAIASMRDGSRVAIAVAIEGEEVAETPTRVQVCDDHSVRGMPR